MDFKQKRHLILNGNMTKVIITLSLPIMLNNFIQTIYNLTDTYWVSKLGDTEVAAMSFVWPVIFFMMALGLGVSIGGTALISQYTGSDRMEEAAKVAGQVISFSTVFSIVMGLIGYFLIPTVIQLMGAEGDMYNQSVTFLRIIFLGMPTMFIFFAFSAIKQGQGDTVTPMIYGAISVALNMILDPILILVFDLGISGAAIATVTSRGIFSLYAIYRLFLSKQGIHLRKNHLKWNKEVLLKLIKVAWPSSIGQSTAALGFLVLNVFIISFGESTMAAFGIGNRINSLILMPAMGIGNALATIVGQNLGADNISRAKKAVKNSTFLATIILVIGGSILFTFAGNVVGNFTKNPVVYEQATYYLKLITASIPLMGFFQVFIGTFQGSGHTIMAMIIMMGRLWGLRIPLIILFKNFTNLGTNSVWYAMILSNFIICIIGYSLYRTGKWQEKVIKKRAV